MKTFHAAASTENVTLLRHVERIAVEAGNRLLPLYSPANRPVDRAGMINAARANEQTAAAGLREALQGAFGAATFVDEDQQTSALPEGEWWVVDAVEGNVNQVHGLPEWGVSIALIRDGVPVVAVVRQPVGDLTFSAVLHGGAFVDDEPLHVSAKHGLEIAVVGTGSAEAGQASTYRKIGESIMVMLESALMVRAQVPSTFPILLVAAGHMDAFWQYEPNLPGVAAGILMTTEAGGTVTTIDGSPWKPGDRTILLAAPGVHGPVRTALETVA